VKNICNRPTCGLLAISLVILGGCGGGGSEETGTTGFLSLGVSDGPIHEAKKVCITFDSIELKSGSDNTLLDLNDHGGPQTINLLDFQGDDSSMITIMVARRRSTCLISRATIHR